MLFSSGFDVYRYNFKPGRVAQSVAQLTHEPNLKVPADSIYPVRPLIFVSPSAVLGRAVFSYWRKYEHLVLINR